MIHINPCELNAAIAAITNLLYTKLSEKDFIFLNIVLSELSKSMFSMELLRGVCHIEKYKKEKHKK